MSLLKHLAVCHLLLGSVLVALLRHRDGLAGLFLLGVGYGGLGAAWGRWTAAEGHWLDIGGGWKRPDKEVLSTVGLHAPALVAGLWLLRRDLESQDRWPI